jgi:hypothetical protein
MQQQQQRRDKVKDMYEQALRALGTLAETAPFIVFRQYHHPRRNCSTVQQLFESLPDSSPKTRGTALLACLMSRLVARASYPIPILARNDKHVKLVQQYEKEFYRISQNNKFLLNFRPIASFIAYLFGGSTNNDPTQHLVSNKELVWDYTTLFANQVTARFGFQNVQNPQTPVNKVFIPQCYTDSGLPGLYSCIQRQKQKARNLRNREIASIVAHDEQRNSSMRLPRIRRMIDGLVARRSSRAAAQQVAESAARSAGFNQGYLERIRRPG